MPCVVCSAVGRPDFDGQREPQMVGDAELVGRDADGKIGRGRQELEIAVPEIHQRAGIAERPAVERAIEALDRGGAGGGAVVAGLLPLREEVGRELAERRLPPCIEDRERRRRVDAPGKRRRAVGGDRRGHAAGLGREIVLIDVLDLAGQPGAGAGKVEAQALGRVAEGDAVAGPRRVAGAGLCRQRGRKEERRKEAQNEPGDASPHRAKMFPGQPPSGGAGQSPVPPDDRRKPAPPACLSPLPRLPAHAGPPGRSRPPPARRSRRA